MIGISQIRDPSQAVKAKEFLSESSPIKEMNVSVHPLFPSCARMFDKKLRIWASTENL